MNKKAKQLPTEIHLADLHRSTDRYRQAIEDCVLRAERDYVGLVIAPAEYDYLMDVATGAFEMSAWVMERTTPAVTGGAQ